MRCDSVVDFSLEYQYMGSLREKGGGPESRKRKRIMSPSLRIKVFNIGILDSIIFCQQYRSITRLWDFIFKIIYLNLIFYINFKHMLCIS
jgi:hypothetical protein